jgi:hypothetical protein
MPISPEAERIVWSKWSDDRTEIARTAVTVWLPLDDLRDFLNRLPGPKLTEMDVYERLRWIEDNEHWMSSPPDELREECFTRYDKEKAKGTEFIAIVHALSEWMSGAREEFYRQAREQHARDLALQDDKNIRSGKDWPKGIGWRRAIGLPGLYCRRAGRLFRYHEGTVTELTEPEATHGVVLGQFPKPYAAARHVYYLAVHNKPPP